MSLSLYDISVPVFIRAFGNLSAILEKGRAHAAASGMSESELLEARLYPDMGNLISQIQRASDTAKLAAIRVGQLEPLPMKDEEATFDDILDRIARTVEFLKSVPASAFEGREGAEVELKNRGGSRIFTAQDYLLTFAVPNFFFHVTTAYALLRHKGVPIGKSDYLWSA